MIRELLGGKFRPNQGYAKVSSYFSAIEKEIIRRWFFVSDVSGYCMNKSCERGRQPNPSVLTETFSINTIRYAANDRTVSETSRECPPITDVPEKNRTEFLMKNGLREDDC